jgi:glycosyltransferase involved in cell wall biosynthesis
MKTVYVNGKFLTQRLTGVQRSASELLNAVDAVLQNAPDEPRYVVLHPHSVATPRWRKLTSQPLPFAGIQGHLWEQVALPLACRDGVLLSLTGSCPAWAHRQVCTFHDAAIFDAPNAYSIAFRSWYKFLFSIQAQRALQLVTVSDFSKQRLIRHLKIEPHRVCVIGNGGEHLGAVRADHSVPDLAGTSTRKNYFLAIGSSSINKNISLLVDAFSALALPDWNLIIVTTTFSSIFKAAGHNRNNPNIIYLSGLSDAQLVSLYDGARALVFPSLYEGFGLPPLEAMSRGCPVIAARAAAIPEVCGSAAIYFDPSSVSDLVKVLQSFVADPRQAERLKRAGRTQVTKWSWTTSAERIVALMRDLA